MVIMTNEYTITKRIAKHGTQAMVLIPKDLENHLPHKTLVKVTLEVIERP